MSAQSPADTPAAPEAGADRIGAIIAAMTPREKLAQLVGAWIGVDPNSGDVAPAMHDNVRPDLDWDEVAGDGLGHITRLYGTRPIAAEEGRGTLRRLQADLRARSRFGIGAIVHEEVLTGVAAWRATTFPSPPAYGATWNPELLEQVGAAIGESLRALEVHQGLAPLLDVAYDARWGRVEECFGEDPYLVGTLGAAYVRGLENAGIVATLKHYIAYSASQAGRNLAPVHVGQRELAEVLLYPFEVALREGGARSVMPSYSDIDGVPSHADAELLTAVLREELGFAGTVVSDYFAVNFLRTQHHITRSEAASAAAALRAGVDIELPDAHCFPALAAAIERGEYAEADVDRALRRVLAQKEELGLLDPPGEAPDTPVDLDPPHHRGLARRVAEQSVTLLSNHGVLPLTNPATLAVIGPNADQPTHLLGDYSFTNHVEVHFPDVPAGLTIPSVLEALVAELPGTDIEYAAGCDVAGTDTSGIEGAAALADRAAAAVVVVGDQAGLFGRGTVGEGNDVDSLELPGVQRQLVEAVLDTGTPVVLVIVSGRPYAIGWAAERAAAVVQAFFPGQEGAGAIAGVLSGRINPSGRTAMSFPRSAGTMPTTYRRAPLAGRSDVTSLDPSEAFAFGHGLGYTSFAYSELSLSAASLATDGTVEASVTVTNTGDRAGADVPQLYLTEHEAPVVRPELALVGYARVELEPGTSVRVTWQLAADRFGHVGLGRRWQVTPGRAVLAVGRSAADLVARAELELTGPARELGANRVLTTPVRLG